MLDDALPAHAAALTQRAKGCRPASALAAGSLLAAAGCPLAAAGAPWAAPRQNLREAPLELQQPPPPRCLLSGASSAGRNPRTLTQLFGIRIYRAQAQGHTKAILVAQVLTACSIGRSKRLTAFATTIPGLGWTVLGASLHVCACRSPGLRPSWTLPLRAVFWHPAAGRDSE